MRVDTLVVHAGRPQPAPPSLSPILYQSSVYYEDTVAGTVALEEATAGVSSYSRTANPTVVQFEGAIAELEGADAALATASGMAAFTLTFLTLLGPQDRVAVSPHSYADTLCLLDELKRRVGFELLIVDLADPACFSVLEHERVTFIVAESPSNPMLRVVDLPRLARYANQHKATLLVDSTLASPINQQPLRSGADLVMHSASKYLSGHYNAIAGVLAGRSALIEKLRFMRTITGLGLDPHTAWLLLQGMQTLAVRVRTQNATAQRVAEYLSQSPAVDFVAYPGLPGNDKAAVGQLSGFGGVLTFGLRAADRVEKFLQSLSLCTVAVSLGGTKTLIESPSLMSHVQGGPENESLKVIPGNAIRLSAGLEDAGDIIADLEAAFAAIDGPGR